MFFPRIPPFSAQNLFEKHPTTKNTPHEKKLQLHLCSGFPGTYSRFGPGVSIDAAVYSKGYSGVSQDVTLVSWLFFYVAKKTPVSAWKDFFFKSEWE